VSVRVISLGIAVLDRVHEIPAFPAVPMKLAATGYRETGGGIAATAAVAVAALGGRAEYWGRLGDDSTGRELAAQLRRRGVDVSGTRVIAGAETPVSAVIVDATGERMIAVYLGRNLDDDTAHLRLDRLGDCGAVLADMRWLQGAEILFATARRHGVTSVLDADVGVPQALGSLLPMADFAIFSELGLSQFAGTGDPEQGLRVARARGGRNVGVTLGASGCRWLEGETPHHEPAFRVAAADTTGAGDTFHGAFALALGEGRDMAAAMRFANAAAAIKCRNGRGWDGMPDRFAVDKLLQGA
jgi:sulfofructose kinase